jgi:condensin complex subunit 1
MVGYCEKLENDLKSKTKKNTKGEKGDKEKEKEKEENNKKKKQKNKKHGNDSQSEDEEDEMQKINGGQEAEVEHDIQILQKIIDEDLLYKNILGKFTPFILNIVTNIFTDNITEENKILYKTSIISLCKFMCVSKKFCEENLQILFDILENEKIEANLKLNICVSIGDLVNRFPNLLQKKIGDFFNCLKSSDISVVRNSMIVISHLVLNDMIKLKGEIVEICLLLELNNEKLNDLVNLFISEYNKKGQNVIYNVIPKALARLNNEYKHLDYSKFQNIVKNLLKFVEKDKQTDGLIEKLFAKLKISTNKKEWRNTTYCLSLLNYNDKGLNKVLELFGNLKEKIIDDDIVNENFFNIFAKYKKTASGMNKENLEDIEKKFFADGKVNLNLNKLGKTNEKNSGRLGSKRTNSDMKSGLKNNIGRSRSKTSKTKDIKEGSDEDYDEDDDDDEDVEYNENNIGSKRNNKEKVANGKNNINNVQNVNNNHNNDNNNSARRSLRTSKTRNVKRKDSFIDDDEDSDE